LFFGQAMTSLSDYLIGFSYLAWSVALAAIAFQIGAAGPDAAALLGLLSFVVCGLAHIALLRRKDKAHYDLQLRDMRQAILLLTEEMERARGAVREAAATGEARAQARNKEILSEVRIIETLINQLAGTVKDKSMTRLDSALEQFDKVLADLSPDTETIDEIRRSAQNLPEFEGARMSYSRDQRHTGPGSTVFDQLSEDQLLELIRAALDENRVDVYVQPVVSLPQRKTRFYESFSSLRTEAGEPIKPNLYVHLAESAGLITVIDNLLLFRCIQFVRRMAKKQSDARMFCNISMRSLKDQYFFNQFIEFLSSNTDLTNNLIFEFGQETFDHCGLQEKANMRRLSQLGFHYSLDKVAHLDLNLAELRDRNFRFVKVGVDVLLNALPAAEDYSGFDQVTLGEASHYPDDAEIIDAEYEASWESEAGEDDETGGAEDPPQAQVPAPQSHIHPADLKDLLDRYGLDLIVEKVESERQAVEVVELDVDYGQGFLFGEPKSIDAEFGSPAPSEKHLALPEEAHPLQRASSL